MIVPFPFRYRSLSLALAGSPAAAAAACGVARAAVAASLEEQAGRMKKKAARLGGEEALPIGAVVQLGLKEVDRAKLDHTNATLVVVELVGKDSYRVANQSGVYRDVVSRSYLTLVPNATPRLLKLDEVICNWKQMPTVGIRSIAAALPSAGGQGVTRCSCTGTCLQYRCACRKAKRQCNSRCHKGNSKCQNCENATRQAGEDK